MKLVYNRAEDAPCLIFRKGELQIHGATSEHCQFRQMWSSSMKATGLPGIPRRARSLPVIPIWSMSWLPPSSTWRMAAPFGTTTSCRARRSSLGAR